MTRGSPADDAAVTRVSVAAVIVNYRTPDLTAECVAKLAAERRSLPLLRAVVVDGGSNDGSADRLGELAAEDTYRDWVSFIPLQLNGGFGWANNQAILAFAREPSPPDFIYLLNPDAQVTEGAVSALVRDILAHPRCGAAGSELLNEDGSLAASAFRFPSPGRELTAAAQSEKLGRLLGVAPSAVSAEGAREVDWVTGASVLIRSEALRQAGLFDDGFFLYFDEVELMHRLWARGWTVRHVPESRVFHLEGAATGLGSAEAQPYPDYWYQSRRRYFALTGGRAALAEANLGWLAGRLAAAPKRLLGRKVVSRASIRKLLRSTFGGPDDLRPSAARWGDVPGKSPAWMKNR